MLRHLVKVVSASSSRSGCRPSSGASKALLFGPCIPKIQSRCAARRSRKPRHRLVVSPLASLDATTGPWMVLAAALVAPAAAVIQWHKRSLPLRVHQDLSVTSCAGPVS